MTQFQSCMSRIVLECQCVKVRLYYLTIINFKHFCNVRIFKCTEIGWFNVDSMFIQRSLPGGWSLLFNRNFYLGGFKYGYENTIIFKYSTSVLPTCPASTIVFPKAVPSVAHIIMFVKGIMNSPNNIYHWNDHVEKNIFSKGNTSFFKLWRLAGHFKKCS